MRWRLATITNAQRRLDKAFLPGCVMGVNIRRAAIVERFTALRAV